MASNIKNQLFSGVFYTALAKYSGIVISLVIAGILARLLSPDDFGIVAVATVIIAFFSLLTDMGISPAIIQHKSLTKDELSTIFSFTVWTGIGISILFFAASWMIADYYESEILRTLCQLLSVNLFFASATIVPGALFYRNKEFKFIAIRSFVIQISAGAAGRDCRPLRSRIICTDYQPNNIQHTHIRHLLPALSATTAFHAGADGAPEDILLFRLPVSIQRHQLLQPQSGQITDWQIHEYVRPRILRKILSPDDASLAKHHPGHHSCNAPHLQ